MKLRPITFATAVASLMLAACSSSPSSQTGSSSQVTWWTWAVNTHNVISTFERAHPNIKVPPVPNYGAGPPFYTKLTTSLAGGSGPCVTFLEFDFLPQFLAHHDLVPITQYVSGIKNKFPAWEWQQVSKDGQIYAVPDNIGPMGLMYQPAVFKKYHLPVPTTWAQFASDAVALHKANPKMYLSYFPPDDPNQLESMFWQAGAYPFKLLPDGSWQVNIDGPIETKVLNYWGKLIDEGAIAADDDSSADWGRHVASNRYAALIGAAWSPTYWIDAYHPPGTTWAVTQMPQWTPGAHVSANLGGGVEAVTKSCPSSQVKNAALFAAQINTAKSQLQLAAKPATKSGGGRGIFVASNDRASVPSFTAPVPNFVGNVNQQFSEYSQNVPTQFEWSPWESAFENFASTQLQAAAAGKITWTHALQVIQSDVVSYAKSAGYSVSS